MVLKNVDLLRLTFYVSAITIDLIETPQSVDQLTVTEKRSRGVSLSWLMTDDGNSPVTQYIIQYTQLTGRVHNNAVASCLNLLKASHNF